MKRHYPPWARFRRWLKKHPDKEIVGDIHGGIENPVAIFLKAKTGITFVVLEDRLWKKGTAIIMAKKRDGSKVTAYYDLFGSLPKWASIFLILISKRRYNHIQARTCLKILNEVAREVRKGN